MRKWNETEWEKWEYKMRKNEKNEKKNEKNEKKWEKMRKKMRQIRKWENFFLWLCRAKRNKILICLIFLSTFSPYGEGMRKKNEKKWEKWEKEVLMKVEEILL